MKLRDLYADFLAHWWTDGGLINNQSISSVGIKPGFGRVDTKGLVRKIWIVTSIPNHYQKNLSEAIKIVMHRAYPEVKTFVTEHCTPCHVPITSDNYKRLMTRAHERYRDEEEIMSNFSKEDQELGKDIRIGGKKLSFRKSKLEGLKNEADSYMYVHKYQGGGGKFLRVTLTIEALAPSNQIMKSYKKSLIEVLSRQGIGFREVRNNTATFLENYGVAGYIQQAGRFPTMLMSDENIAANCHNRIKGLVGGSGILMGQDWQTKLPLFINFFASSAAQIVLVYGRTGSGKTFLCFQTAISLIAEGVHCSAIDIKGNEWNVLAKYVPVTEISVGGSKPRFVNTLRLDDVGATHENSREFFNMAIRGTVQLLSTMINLQPNEGNPRDMEDLLTQAVTKVLHAREVYADRPESFKNTSGIKLQDLLPVLQDLCGSETISHTQKAQLGRMIIDRCANFLQTDSGADNMFAHEVTIGEILDSPMVVYSFNKNSDSMLDLKDTLRVFMVQFLDTKKQAIRKSQKLHSACFYEELQRCQQFGNLIQYIKHAVTGSRSNNVKMFLLINDLSSLDNGALESVKSSITTKIIGVTNENDRQRLAKQYGCADILPMITKVSDEENYRRCFVIDYDTGDSKDPLANTKDRTIFKVVLPDDIAESFRTADLKED